MSRNCCITSLTFVEKNIHLLYKPTADQFKINLQETLIFF